MSIDRVVAFDTSLISENGGDNIIMKYINNILQELWGEDFIVHIPTHDSMGRNARYYCEQAKYKIMCGTNILTANMLRTKMWNVNYRDIKHIKNTILLGAGWREYEKPVNLYTKYFWRKTLEGKYLHSVRDEYTKKRLQKIGINNIVNTGCPTMWGLTQEFCAAIPEIKSKNVITTLTNYRATKPEVDEKMFNILFEHYDHVYIWIQALEDYAYLKSLKIKKEPEIVCPGLYNFDNILLQNDIEYCGTRLHAGIEALNQKKRTLIIAKDNRALEIGKDTGLPVISEENLDKLADIIESPIKCKIQIPISNIERWKAQFKEIS